MKLRGEGEKEKIVIEIAILWAHVRDRNNLVPNKWDLIALWEKWVGRTMRLNKNNANLTKNKKGGERVKK